ncbi:MAG: hypothetical protein D6689_06320 [Deltaproteobacteria bacterium]|nr:MAG: hypothetical protein D6689_06320 [Deltaproteobacteria bacterium]
MNAHAVRSLVLGLLGVVAVGTLACGDEPPPARRRSPGDSRARPPAPPPPPPAAAGGYTKVPDEYRHEFTEDDFKPDPSGDVNRDPFRSYVFNAPRTESSQGAAPVLDVNDICTKDNSVASNYSLRNLKLIGIVLRGTKSYALFRDSGGYGHIVRRADCLGKEKARVDTIGTGFVRLTVIPEAPPGAPAPAPQTRDVQLYPEEIEVEANGSTASAGEATE